MTHQNDYTFASDLAEKGLEAVPELLRVLINTAMQAERAKYLQAEEYKRTEERIGHANGYKPRPYAPGLAILPLPSLKSEKVVFTLQPWKKECAVKEP
jgi:hypothetical protein